MNFSSQTTIVLGTLALLACTARQDLGNRAPSEPEPSGSDVASAAETDDRTAATPGDQLPSSAPPPTEDEENEEAPSPDAPTYFSGPLGFTARDAYSFDRFSPTGNRQTRGIMVTSFVSACDKAKANAGTKVLHIVFSPDVAAIPSTGVYPISDTFGEGPMAIARVWTVNAAGCSGMSLDGGHFVSGNITLTRSDATGLEGTFEGTLVGQASALGVVTGHFVAPRCGPHEGACNP